jgi:hypothetical protein
MLKALQPDALLERFAHRKSRAAGNTKEFIKLKGSKGQVAHEEDEKKVKEENELVGFKCMHYSVTESNGHVEITIVKKILNQELTLGVRTVPDTAQPPKDYTHIDEVIHLAKRDVERKIKVPIVDDEEWNPDLEFWVELYDPEKYDPDKEAGEEDRLPGDDTRCKVTILDEDFPGTIGFASTDVHVSKNQKEVEIEVERVDGSDGTISCWVSTEPLTEHASPTSAVEFEDYLPKHEKLTFRHNETSTRITIELVNEKVAQIEEKMMAGKTVDGEDEGSEEEECDVIFKIKLDKPEPTGVKVSKKNVCLVTICKSDDFDKEEAEKQKLI